MIGPAACWRCILMSSFSLRRLSMLGRRRGGSRTAGACSGLTAGFVLRRLWVRTKHGRRRTWLSGDSWEDFGASPHLRHTWHRPTVELDSLWTPSVFYQSEHHGGLSDAQTEDQQLHVLKNCSRIVTLVFIILRVWHSIMYFFFLLLYFKGLGDLVIYLDCIAVYVTYPDIKKSPE